MTVSDHIPKPTDPVVEALLGVYGRSDRGPEGQFNTAVIELLRQLRDYNLSGSRLIPCEATGTNLITLTPCNPTTPHLERYNDFDAFQFVAAATSSGDVTATVVPVTGTLATLKVYKTNGAAQATTNDVVSGSFYVAYFVDSLDSNAGGFVLK